MRDYSNGYLLLVTRLYYLILGYTLFHPEYYPYITFPWLVSKTESFLKKFDALGCYK